MLDPIPPLPAAVRAYIQPLANKIGLPILPLHIHEILLVFACYHWLNTRGAPALSRRFFPTIYPTLNARTKLNWDVHVVSLVQSCVVNVLALWAMWKDEERRAMTWDGRVWGYTGLSGMVQAFAAGYFLWDLMVSAMNVSIFGWGLLAHAVCALVVFCLGYRPFVNFYAPTFILYELSSPFLNFHWFFDKINMTGSRWQLINGILLLATFFSCRLIWGTYQSIRVYQDVWAALHSSLPTKAPGSSSSMTVSVDASAEVMRFATEQVVPRWLAVTYLCSNILLNTLNFYWFGKMIETVRKRFQPPKEKKGRASTTARGVREAKSAVSTSVKLEGDTRSIQVNETEIRQRKD